MNGIDVLARDGFRLLQGQRVGLITNHSGHDRLRRPTRELLRQAPGVKLVSLFSPEHGLKGDLDAHVPNTRDPATGLPVYSLYGGPPLARRPGESDAEHRLRGWAPRPEALESLDALVFDIQDVGARFYTYSSTLGSAIRAAGEAGKRIVVLDRVNPIGDVFEGPVLSDPVSEIGFHPVPVRHGLTLGEFGLLVNRERRFGADLVVVKVENWHPGQWFDETGLPWTPPSPAMRTLAAATLYPGVCLLEGCAVSMGRGTDTPFERFGAPYVDDVALAKRMNAAGIEGVRFIPVEFRPVSSRFAGETCRGVQMVVVDRDRLPAVDVGIMAAKVLLEMYPKSFDIDRMSRLLGDAATLEAIKSGKSLADIKASWTEGLARFRERRKAVQLYT